MGGFKDKDLMQDTGGKTKVQKNYGGNHKRPPRLQQRNEQRNRFLTKENKLDMNRQSFDSQEDLKQKNSQQLDLQIGQNGQVYVKDQPSKNEVMTFSDLVNIPSQVQNIRNYDDFNTSLNNSMNDDSRYDVQIQQENKPENIGIDSFDFKDDDSPEIVNSDVSNDDLILSDEEQEDKQKDPFDNLFNDDSEQEENDSTENWGDQQQKQEEQQKDQEQEENKDQKQQDSESNDSIDQYLNMQIDDSKLSEQNKKKLDGFTTQQLDAFKKFLYQKKNQE